MALTAEQQARIRFALGYPDLFRYKNTRLEGILTGHQLSLETEAIIIESLANMEVVNAKILGVGISQAGLKRADVIEFYEGKTLGEVREYGRMYVGRISISLGVPIYSDIFSSRGYLGDSYTASGFGGGGGNTIKLG